MDKEKTEQSQEDDREEMERFFDALKDLAKIWPIFGFRCNGQPYVTNAESISRNKDKKK